MSDNIKESVDRFLAWKLPTDFYPDCHIHFDREKAEKWGPQLWPSGTNLLNAEQARAMLDHVTEPLRAQLADMTAERDAAQATIERMQQTALIDTQQIAQYGTVLDTIAHSTLSLPLCRRLAYNTLKGSTK